MEVAVINHMHCVTAAAAINMLQSTYAKSEACGHQGRLEETAFQSHFHQITYIIVQLIIRCPAHGVIIILVGFWFFQIVHNSVVMAMKIFFLLLHKTGLQSKITSARNDVSLPPCNSLTAWQTKTILIVSQVQTGVMECCFSCRALSYLTAMKKSTCNKAISGWPLGCRQRKTHNILAGNNVNHISACGSHQSSGYWRAWSHPPCSHPTGWTRGEEESEEKLISLLMYISEHSILYILDMKLSCSLSSCVFPVYKQ